MAWKNLWRHKIRTILTVLAMAGSLFLAITLVNMSKGSYGKMIDQGVRSGSGHIGIYRQGYLAERLAEQSFPVDDLLEKISSLSEVKVALPHLQFSSLAQSAYESRGALLFGLSPSKEAPNNPYIQKIPQGRFLLDSDKTQAVIGVGLAKELRIKVNKSFVITLQDKKGELRIEKLKVVGFLQTGIKELDNSLVMVNLPEAQNISGYTGQIHELSILLHSAKQQKKVFPLVKAMLSDRPELVAEGWQKAMPNLSNAIQYDYTSLRVILFLLVVIVGIGIINTFLMSVLERTREFGTLMAIGASPGFLGFLVITEASFTGILGIILGWIGGCSATYYLITHGLDLTFLMAEGQEFGGVFFDPIIRATWNISTMVSLSILLFMICLGASLYPAWQAGRIDPVKALHD